MSNKLSYPGDDWRLSSELVSTLKLAASGFNDDRKSALTLDRKLPEQKSLYRERILPKTRGHSDVVFAYFSSEHQKVHPANHQ